MRARLEEALEIYKAEVRAFNRWSDRVIEMKATSGSDGALSYNRGILEGMERILGLTSEEKARIDEECKNT